MITKKEKKIVTKSIILSIGSLFILSGFVGLDDIPPLFKVIIGGLIMFGGAFLFDL